MTIYLSVIICTHNRAKMLLRTLSRLCSIGFGRRAGSELILVDNAGTDDTPALAGRFSRELPIRYVREERLGKWNALNCGIPLARADRIVFLDDDVLPDWRIFDAYCEAFQTHPDIHLFGGRIDLWLPAHYDGNLVTLPQAKLVLAQSDFGDRPRLLTYPETPAGPNMAARRSGLGSLLHFEPLPGHEQSIALEDACFFRRAMAAGQRTLYVPAARVSHIVRPEQLSYEYFAERYGRCCIAQEQLDANGVNSGLPLYCYRRIAVAAMKAALGTMRGGKARLESRLEFAAKWRVARYLTKNPEPKPAIPASAPNS